MAQKEKSADQKVTKARPKVGPDGKLDKKALVEQYTPFVRSIASKVKKTLSKNIEFADLESYGMMGLLEAAERYDPLRGANFMTFSYYRVRGAIYDGLRGMGWVSRTEYQKIRFEERATSYLENQANRDMGAMGGRTSAEAELEGLADKVSRLVTIYVTSLEAQENLQVEDTKVKQQDEHLYDLEMKGHVKAAMAQLPEQEQTLLSLYYFKDLTLKEVGEQLGLSKSWTSRRHAQAIDKLSEIIQGMLQSGTAVVESTKKKTRGKLKGSKKKSG